jgi:hypothetical protein
MSAKYAKPYSAEDRAPKSVVFDLLTPPTAAEPDVHPALVSRATATLNIDSLHGRDTRERTRCPFYRLSLYSLGAAYLRHPRTCLPRCSFSETGPGDPSALFLFGRDESRPYKEWIPDRVRNDGKGEPRHQGLYRDRSRDSRTGCPFFARPKKGPKKGRAPVLAPQHSISNAGESCFLPCPTLAFRIPLKEKLSAGDAGPEGRDRKLSVPRQG